MRNERLGPSLRTGALAGLSVWLFYGTAEWSATCFLPRLAVPGHAYIPVHPGFIAVVFALYAVAGLLSGLLCASATSAFASKFEWIRLRRDGLAIAGVYFSFMLVVGTGTIAHLPGSTSFRIGAVYLLLAVFIAFSYIAFYGAHSRLACLCLPSWSVSLLLLLIPITAERWPGTASAPILIGIAFVISVALLQLFLFSVRRTAAILDYRSAVLAASLAALAIGTAFFLRQSELISPIAAQTPPTGPSPNVILITLDTVGAGHLSLYGYGRETSPHLTELGRHATVFSQAMSTGDMTLSSHASLFTGLYASWHHAHYAPDHSRGRPLAVEHTTIAEFLASRGYATLGVVANYPYLGPAFGLAQGFQRYDYRSPVPFLANSPRYLFRTKVRSLIARFVRPATLEVQFRSAEAINASVDTLLRERTTDRRPFFLFINYMDAHWPYLPPPPFDTAFPGKAPAFTTAQYFAAQIAVSQLKRGITYRERDHLVSQYDGAIRYLDSHVGRLLSRLRQLQLFDNSLIIITSDHGEAFGDKNLIGHGVSVYADQVHVPLIIKYPRSTVGVVEPGVVSLVDVMPTILEVLGYPPVPSSRIHGTSLLRPAPSSRHVFSETFIHPFMSQWHLRFQRDGRALLSEHLKFIRYSDGRRELYDLESDPQEDRNLFVAHHPLETALLAWSASIPPLLRHPPAPVRTQTLEVLRSLGYTQ